MPSREQVIGDRGVSLVTRYCGCLRCKKPKGTLRVLPPNFKCADIICDFCGYLAQVKTKSVDNVEILTARVAGAAWEPQRERMDAGIFFPLFLVQMSGRKHAVYYLAADLQSRDIFIPRRPLTSNARRAGWRGFYYDLKRVPPGAFVRLK